MFFEQSPIRPAIGLGTSNQIRSGEGPVLMVGTRVGMIHDSSAAADKPCAELGVLGHPKSGIEVSRCKDQVATDAQVTCNEIRLIENLSSSEGRLRKEKRRTVHEERQS